MHGGYCHFRATVLLLMHALKRFRGGPFVMTNFFVQAQKRFRERQKSKVGGFLQRLFDGFHHDSL